MCIRTVRIQRAGNKHHTHVIHVFLLLGLLFIFQALAIRKSSCEHNTDIQHQAHTRVSYYICSFVHSFIRSPKEVYTIFACFLGFTLSCILLDRLRILRFISETAAFMDGEKCARHSQFHCRNCHIGLHCVFDIIFLFYIFVLFHFPMKYFTSFSSAFFWILFVYSVFSFPTWKINYYFFFLHVYTYCKFTRIE